jgi:hypothetical protein
MAGWIDASISKLQCSYGNHRSVHTTFNSDTDMVTMGIGSLCSIVTEQIVVAELLPTELGDATGHAFEKRVNQILERDDLRYVPLLRAEEAASDMGASFAEFRAAYRQPRLIYACPYCGAEAVSVGVEAPADFQKGGGKIINLTEIELRG